MNEFIGDSAFIDGLVSALLNLGLHVEEGLIGKFDLVVELGFLLLGEEWFLAGFECKRLIKGFFYVIKGISLISNALL